MHRSFYFCNMISYNPKNWSAVLWKIPKSDTLRRLFPIIFILAVYSWIIAYLEIEYFHLGDDNKLKGTPQMHSMLGFAISMLLVFRTNTAYDRWWEGRKLWGSLVNNSRNLALKLNSYLPHHEEHSRNFFVHLIPRFAFELINHLQSENVRYELDDQPHPEITGFDKEKHVPAQIVSLLTGKIQQLYRENIITGEQLIVLNNELTAFMDVCGACERIKNTPIPFSYSGFIKKFIFIYVITLPFGFVFTLGYYVIPVVAFIFYVLASLELIAEEIEDPFGKDTNDLPLEKIAANIQKNVKHILH